MEICVCTKENIQQGYPSGFRSGPGVCVMFRRNSPRPLKASLSCTSFVKTHLWLPFQKERTWVFPQINSGAHKTIAFFDVLWLPTAVGARSCPGLSAKAARIQPSRRKLESPLILKTRKSLHSILVVNGQFHSLEFRRHALLKAVGNQNQARHGP